MATASPAEYAANKELRKKRIEVTKAMEEAALKPVTEKRDMSAEESAKFDTMTLEFETLTKRIDALEKAWAADEPEGDDDDTDADMGEEERSKRKAKKPREKRAIGVAGNPQRGGSEDASGGTQHRREQRSYVEAFNKFIMPDGGTAAARATGYHEKRNLQMDVDIKGGYMVLPLKMSQNILKKVDDLLPFQQKATVIQVPDAASLGVPTIENNPDNGDWTTEIANITADNSMSMGKRQLTPTPIRKRILVSERLLRMAFNVQYDSADDNGASTGGSAQGMIEDRLAYVIARTKEIAYMTGNGVGQPLGAFVASTRGISTARDVTTGSTTGWTWPNLVAGKFSLKTQYHGRAEWFMHRLSLSKIMQIASTTNIPILVNSGIPSTPTMLLDRPLNLTENAPSTFSTDAYVALLGDPKFYWIADSLATQVKVANELYMETGQVGFFVAAESDGMPVLEEAWVRFKCNT